MQKEIQQVVYAYSEDIKYISELKSNVSCISRYVEDILMYAWDSIFSIYFGKLKMRKTKEI